MESPAQTTSPEEKELINIADLTREELERIADKYGLKIRQILDGGKEFNHDPALMDWRRLLEPRLPGKNCMHWARCLKYWLPHRDKWIEFFRDTLNTHEMRLDVLKEQFGVLLTRTDSTVDLFLQEFFPNQPDMREKFAVSSEIRECMDPLKLICCSVYGDLDRTRKGFPLSRGSSNRAIKAWEARRKLALSLLHRSISQEPRLANRQEDSSYFEDYLLRDRTGLIDPLENYKSMRIVFRVMNGRVECSEIADKEALNPDFTMEGYESVVLYKFQMYGRPKPYEEPKSVMVYAFPGNKYEIDAQNPFLPTRQKEELKTRKTIINYKSPESIALKTLRGRQINDYIRCTLLVTNEEELALLQGILNTKLGSLVNRLKHGVSGSGNRASSLSLSKSYRAIQVVEDLHNEGGNRNFNIEIRMGLLPEVILDKSRLHSAGHDEYKKRRALDVAHILFPPELYPELHSGT